MAASTSKDQHVQQQMAVNEERSDYPNFYFGMRMHHAIIRLIQNTVQNSPSKTHFRQFRCGLGRRECVHSTYALHCVEALRFDILPNMRDIQRQQNGPRPHAVKRDELGRAQCKRSIPNFELSYLAKILFLRS